MRRRISLKIFELIMFSLWLIARFQGISRVILVADRHGQLANRLTVAANLTGYALRSNSVLIDLTLIGLVSAEDLPRVDVCHGVVKLSGSRCWLPSVLLRLLKRANVRAASEARSTSSIGRIPVLRAYSTRCTLDSESCMLLRSRVVMCAGIYFDLPNPSKGECQAIRELLRSTSVVSPRSSSRVIGCHVRQGDYRSWRNGEHYFTPAEYGEAVARTMLDASMEYTTKVVSDEIIDPASFSGTIDTRFLRGTPADDLASLASCDLIICTYSSFAFWASYIGQVPIIQLSRDRVHPQKIRLTAPKTIKFPHLDQNTWSFFPSDGQTTCNA